MVYITGFGIISGMGCGAEETWATLQQGRPVIGKVSFLETALRHYPAVEVKKSNADLVRLASLPEDKIYSRTFLLGLIAAQQAMRMAGLNTAQGILGATTIGGMDLNERYYKRIMEEGDKALRRQLASSFECADCTEQIANHFDIRTHVTTMSTACSSSANAIMTATRMIRNGLADSVLAGGMDALSRFSINGFNSLEILSPTGCRPFDQQRNGVTIGEGAAFLVLESEKAATGKKIYGEIIGYANHSEAFHQTASSPDGAGAIMTMRHALKTANLQPEDIDYINAHGTGTQINDLSEGNAIGTVFGNKIPPVSSTKAYTGHTLAAAGAVEAVLSLLSIKEQTLLPNLGLENVMEELPFLPYSDMRCEICDKQPSQIELNHILSNSFGFGGANTTLIIKRV
ncbi:MAG: beta-ketoacyl-[acyl-carrier-protein] synthase family protein [Bacteroidales bacterium]|nr:beta-ketoacyl-[acyl-carrier-protein] synthase family protein [Bacteroidales bacterium]